MARALAIDYGDKRIGLAISDPNRLVVRGLPTVLVSPKHSWLAEIVEHIVQNAVSDVVVGMPRNMDGSYGEAADKVDAFIDALEPLLPETVAVHCLDERLTSVIAQQRLRETGKKPSRNKALIDQEAACLILEDFLKQQDG